MSTSGNSFFRIGILGGQGALASATFHRRLIYTWSQTRSCTSDFDYPVIDHLSRPMPGIGLEGLESPAQARETLAAVLAGFYQRGAGCVAMPCNSLDDLARDPGFQLARMPLMTPWGCAKAAFGRNPLIVLCARSRRNAFSQADTPAWQLPPEHVQIWVDHAIAFVVQGNFTQAQEAFDRVLRLLRQEAAESAPLLPVLLACTELSCLKELSPPAWSFWLRQLPLIDAMDELATRVTQHFLSDNGQGFRT